MLILACFFPCVLKNFQDVSFNMHLEKVFLKIYITEGYIEIPMDEM